MTAAEELEALKAKLAAGRADLGYPMPEEEQEALSCRIDELERALVPPEGPWERRCKRHPEVITQSPDGMFDGVCGHCEAEASESDYDAVAPIDHGDDELRAAHGG